jgi:multidrug efflux pump subunit AcrB
MKDLLIPATTGNVKLSDVANVTQINGPTQITHINASRTATVSATVTSSNVLLDLVHQYRKKGLDARAAVIEGGRRRLRPILMTAIATILALLPMALGLSKSSGFIAGPLAIVVIGGLTSSTILTLLLVPTLYVIVEDIRGRVMKQEPAKPRGTAESSQEEKQQVTA